MTVQDARTEPPSVTDADWAYYLADTARRDAEKAEADEREALNAQETAADWAAWYGQDAGGPPARYFMAA